MKIKLTLLVALVFSIGLQAMAQPTKTFYLSNSKQKLKSICEYLNNEHHFNISFNHSDKALQKEVSISKGEYSFEKLFQQYFQPNGLAYKTLSNQIIIYSRKEEAPFKRVKETRVTLNGYVSDSVSGERLQGATIALLDKGLAATSNAYGFYSLTVPEGVGEVIVNVVGYEPIIQSLELEKDTVIPFRLAPATTTLTAVTITTNSAPVKKVPLHQSTQTSMIEFPVDAIESMPKLLGETDVFRALQFLPGVQSGGEISSGLYVRGGTPDQNLILLDGVPVYNASHLFGLFSVFNSDALQSVQLYKGGFPARYGGRLSSVVDIRMKEGNKNAWHGEGGIGLIASRFTMEGPLSKGRSSIMVSGRVTNWGPLMKYISGKASTDNFDSKVSYAFYDLNLKTNFNLGKKDHLYFSGYFGKDQLKSDEEYTYNYNGPSYHNRYGLGLKWGNATAVARWNHQFNKKIFSNATMHYSRYQYYLFTDDEGSVNSTNEYSRYYQKNSSDLQDVAIKYDLDIIPNPKHYIRTGISATRHHFLPGVFHNITADRNSKKDTTISDGRTVSEEYDIYVEDDVFISNKLKANIGLHGTAFNVGSKFYTSLQPRISARFLLSESMSVKGSFVYMNQYIHLLTNSGIGLPTDLWVPVTERIPAQKSLQYTFGMAYTSPKQIELSIEAYYKDMENVLEYEEGAAFTNTTINWEQRVAIGNGFSKGVEFLAQKKKGRTTGLFGYTLSKSDRKFETINEGKSFPFRYDRRHDLKLAISHKFNERKELNFDWVFGSGQAVTIPIETYVDQNGEMVTVYTERNGFRMPVYHRADLSMSFHKQKRKWHRSWIIGVYNIYGRQNPLFIRFNSYDMDKVTGLSQTSIMPFPIPSFSYQIKF